MRSAILGGLLILAGASAAAGEETGPRTAPVLVELFTSQGCSSCPPADAFAGELRRRDDVLVLSFHVNYWDYIGWRDPFATQETTRRQRAYARTLQIGNVYTPQMVIDGSFQAIGSDVSAVNQAITLAAKHRLASLPVEFDLVHRSVLRVKVGDGDYVGSADVFLIQFDDERRTNVLRGENAGHELVNFNVVRDMRKIGMWNGASTQFDIAWSDIADSGFNGCAVLVQAAGQGPVLAVAPLDIGMARR